jgi:hypothetical protein
VVGFLRITATMRWRVTYPQGPGLRVQWADIADVEPRLEEYRRFAVTVPVEEQQRVELYAQATYLKYRSARENFAATVGNFQEWSKSRLKRRECLGLIEAWTDLANSSLAGALLLRSAWTGDVVVDFVGTNFGVTKYGNPPRGNVGPILLLAATCVGKACGAELIWAETAAETEKWWSSLLASEQRFIKVDYVAEVESRLRFLLNENHVEFAEET